MRFCSWLTYQRVDCQKCPEFNLCQSCYLAGKFCPSKQHTLDMRLCSFDCSANPRAVTDCRRPLLTSMSCNECKSIIKQGRFYHCCHCVNDDFDLCHSCYLSGVRCSIPTTHTLQKQYFGNAANVARFPEKCSRTHMVSSMASCGACHRCEAGFQTGYFYYCCACNGDGFDLCSDFYRKGRGCDNPQHQLSIHVLD